MSALNVTFYVVNAEKKNTHQNNTRLTQKHVENVTNLTILPACAIVNHMVYQK